MCISDMQNCTVKNYDSQEKSWTFLYSKPPHLSLYQYSTLAFSWLRETASVWSLDQTTTVHETNKAFKMLESLSLIQCNCLQNSNKGTLAPTLGQIIQNDQDN